MRSKKLALALVVALMLVAFVNSPLVHAQIQGPNMVLQLDGNADYVEIPSAVAFNGSVTAEAWFQIRAFRQEFKDGIVVRFGGLNPLYGLVLQLQETLEVSVEFFVSSPLTTPAHTVDHINLGEWYHVAGTYDGKTGCIALYLNGKIQGKLMCMPDIPINDDGGPMYIGYYHVDSRQDYFDGMIDEVRIWDVAMTPEEIASSMRRRIPLRERASMAGYWTMDEVSLKAEFVHDGSGNRNRGTLLGNAHLVQLNPPAAPPINKKAATAATLWGALKKN